MQYRKDIKSGNKLSVLGFGCMRFPKTLGSFDLKKSEALVMKAIESGVNYFDTARAYPGNEEALGTILADNKARKNIFIASKLPTWTSHSAEDIDRHFKTSLEKLKTDYIDYYLIHMLSEMTTWEKLQGFGIEEWIAQKKKSGQIRQMGFSFHGMRDQYMRVLDAYDWDFTLIQYNYSDINYQAGVSGLKAARSKGLPVFIMEPLLGGRLVNNLPKAITHVFNKTRADWTPAAWGLNWLWNQSEVTMVLSGMNDIKQLEDNLAMAEKAQEHSLSETEEAAYEQARVIFNDAYKIKCTGCAYCLPCPKDVNIPGCFSAYNTSFSLGRYRGVRQYGQSVSFTAKNMRNASRCIECGKCEKHCPQNIAIRECLKLVKKRLEPFWLWIPLKIIRKFMSF
ncbi:MAG: aldo/keto reductase [Spirochaetaceae bacterium]|jgi:predicted aldo/keto reductase-like oxidoreductase|nr:aldo/keto reductase [Spirochaetaceae bacterium]